jgi:DNA-binding NarL/FixJ family response regulator
MAFAKFPAIMSSKKKIAIVDDHPIFRKGLISLLESYEDLRILFEAEDGRDLLEKTKIDQPEVILLDIEMPVMNGIEATVNIKQLYPHIKIIILSIHDGEMIIDHLIKKGANGFLSKDSNIEKVVLAINIVAERGYYFDYEVMNSLVKNACLNNRLKTEFTQTALSEREVEILKLICKEYTNKEIANELCLSVRTIDTYRTKIFEKAKVKNAVGLVFFAIKYGLIDM